MANTDLLERAWDGVGNFFGGLMHGFERGVTAMFGQKGLACVTLPAILWSARGSSRVDIVAIAWRDGVIFVRTHRAWA